MNKRILSGIAATTFAATMAFAAPASAAVTFDPATGSGFVGKGDVQLALELNNKQLQDAVNENLIAFVTDTTTVSEVSWVCTNTRNESTQERERTTTTSTSGVVSAVARDGKKQITGFNLSGYLGDPVETSTSEGNTLNSCPTNWVLTPAGDPEIISQTGTLSATLGTQSGVVHSF